MAASSAQVKIVSTAGHSCALSNTSDVDASDSFASACIKAELAADLEKLAKAPDSEHRDFFRQWLRSTVVAPDMVEQRDDAFPTYLAYISGAIGQPSFVEHQMRRHKSSDTSEVVPRYHELGVMPVKLIWGQEDGWQTVGWDRKLESAIPGATLEVIRNAGHFAMEDAPDEIGKHLVDFLELTRA